MPDERKPEQRPDDAGNTAEHPPSASSDTSEHLAAEEPPIDDDATEDLHLLGDPPAPPVQAEGADARYGSIDSHDLPTMPMPVESQETDPKRTLPGSGGFDPNPDFNQFAEPPAVEAGFTVPHIVPFEHTMVHIPGEAPPLPRQPGAPAAPSLPYHQPQEYAQQRYAPTSQYMPPGQQYTQPGQLAPQQQAAGAPPAQRLPRRKNRTRRILGCTPGCVVAFIALFGTFCGGLTLITLVLTATLGAQLEERLSEQVAQVDSYQNFESTFYLDRGGALLYEDFSEGRRTNVAYQNFPQDLINATLAIEDDTFFTNPGFEVEATFRAFLQYVGLAQGESGGSTITQQLVRNVLFNYEYRAERSVQRKVEEILLAYLLTQRKSKEEILALYLNEIYYGNLAYGAQAAAQTFFSKNVQDLTLGEAALLAGLPQAPANLNPLNPDPNVQEAVNDRWRLVLDRMVTERFITDAQRNDALRQGLTFNPPDVPLKAPHFTVYAQNELERLMTELGYTPEDITRGGLRVYTTVDLAINDMAQVVARDQIAALAANNVTNAAVVVLKPLTGEILAMVGSVDYNNDAIDGRVNVTIAPRQPGSTMKPFTYSSALELGMTPGNIIWDTPTDIAGYVPRNYDGAFHGPVRMRTALANSYNIPAVQTLRRVGVDYVLALMQRFGVQSLGTDASRYGLSLTLGGGEITLLELTRAYTVFANQGVLVPSTSILCVINSKGEILYQYENGCPGQGIPTGNTVNRGGYGTQVLDPRIAFLMTDILADNATRSSAMGANSPLNTGSLQTAVKTGTTNDFKDNWTVGYTRNVAVGVWVGNSNGDPMINTSGLTGAAPIWNKVITTIYNDATFLNQFGVNGQLMTDRAEPPSGLSLRRLCNLNQLREPATDCSASINEWFLDTPAAIPGPDGALQYPPPPEPVQEVPPQTGPWLREVEPDIYRVLVMPIPQHIAAAIAFNTQPAPPPPLYCQVPIEVASSAVGAREQLFLAPPPVPADAVQAENYARNNGIAFLPTIACTPELLTAGGSFGGGGATVITAFISQPTPGQVITDALPIIGTADFAPGQAQYYKLEIVGGQFPSWVTIGETHGNPVVNGQLEILPGPPGLQPGSYQLQLVIVGNDGNYVQPPYVVPFVVQ